MYFITCFERYGKTKLGYPDIGSSRTVGYYPHKEWAVEDLYLNNLDIHEDMYDYAVIEKIPMGLYPVAEETIYFKLLREEKEESFVTMKRNSCSKRR